MRIGDVQKLAADLSDDRCHECAMLCSEMRKMADALGHARKEIEQDRVYIG